jgi:hypothetical protein
MKTRDAVQSRLDLLRIRMNDPEDQEEFRTLRTRVEELQWVLAKEVWPSRLIDTRLKSMA